MRFEGKNRQEAAGYCKMAAEQGDLEALRKYGEMLERGVRVSKNLPEANFCYGCAGQLSVSMSRKYRIMAINPVGIR